jgi:MFS family permease
MAGSLLALVVLILVERRVPSPIIDFSLFTNRIFVSANVSLVLTFVSLFAVSFLLPFYLVQLRGFSLTTAGLGLLQTPLSLTLVLLSPTTARLADRFGSRWLAARGLAVACAGLILIATLNTRSSVPLIIGALIIIGVGESLFFPPNNSTLIGSAPRHRHGVASGMMATSRAIGQSTTLRSPGRSSPSSAVPPPGASLAAARMRSRGLELQSLQATFLHAFQITILVCCAIEILGIFTALTRGHERGDRSS